MLVPFVVSLVMIGLLQLYLTRSFIGRAILAVSQDSLALQLMAASPTRIKQIAFGISVATCALAGTFLIIIQPVEPSIGRDYIGRIFAICVLGGMTSFPGHGRGGGADRHRREHHRDVLRPLLGAGGRVRLPADHAGRAPGRPVGTLSDACDRSGASRTTLSRTAGEGGERSEAGEGSAAITTLTLPRLRRGPLPLPQCGRGADPAGHE